MQISFPWLETRKKLILLCLTEILLILFININFNFGGLSFSQNRGLFSLFLIPFWFLLSYLTGRYSYNEKIYENKKIVIFFNLLLRTFLVSLISFNFTCFFFKVNNYGEFYKILINYCTAITLTINVFVFPLIIFFLKKVLDKETWIFFGNNDLLNIINNEIKWSRKKIEVKNKINILKNFYPSNINDIEGIFLDSEYKFNEFEFNELIKMQKSGLKIISLENWCESKLQRLPPTILSQEYLLKGNFSVPINFFQLRIKRISDLIFGIILLILTLPIVLISIIFIFFEDKKYFIYKQDRVGLNQNIYTLYKLRTMRFNSENGKPQWATKNDSRITKVGRFLRKTRIDELPQLISVIKGDMSLIGPRPERKEIDEELINKIPNYNIRYLLRPGLSGWAQVNYPYGSSVEDSKIKLSYDIYYLKNFSIWLDMLIFFKTIRLVLLKRGSDPIR